MLEKKIIDNDIDNWILIEPEKYIFGELPKEESQMFFGKEFQYNNDFTTTTDVNKRGVDNRKIIDSNTNFPLNKEDALNKTLINSSVTETDYAGIINKKIKTLLDQNFCDIKYYKEDIWDIKDVYGEEFIQKFKIVGNNQFFKLPKFLFKKESNTPSLDPDVVESVNDYGIFYITIEPKYIETEIVDINLKEHYKYDNILNTLGLGIGNRRNIYKLNFNDFQNTIWQFEDNFTNDKPILSNRLLGSLVVNKQLNGLYKNEKIITNDLLDFDLNEVFICLSPDYMGVDSAYNKFNTNDTIRIYPQDKYFEPFIIRIDFLKDLTDTDRIKNYLLNDAVRDLKTNLIEIYDENGVTIEDNGQLSGKVKLAFQVIENQGKEIRKNIEL